MTVGQSSTYCRLYGDQEDAFQRLTPGPFRLLKRELLEAHQVGCHAAHVGIMFSCRLETYAVVPLGLFAFIVCERFPAGLLWIPVSFRKSAIRESNMCFVFH